MAQSYSSRLDSTELLERQLSGQQLYGENLSPQELESWYAQEEFGYFDLVSNYYNPLGSDRSTYGYGALNRFHAFRTLQRRRFGCCVALGCAAGDDVAPLAPLVQHFLAVEPAEKWWRSSIGGKPARYVKPSIRGAIDLDSGAADLATSFGVLHHVPNVSDLVAEISRVLSPGGWFVVREPISWMGDWRKSRPGLTANERGLPIEWFEDLVRKNGFQVARRHLCLLAPLAILAKKFGISNPYQSAPVVAIDWLLSESLRWNVHYRRDRFTRKIAPGSAFWLLQKRPPTAA